ncbi:MAG: UPF0149 family protein [Gammaproteobacteria bacterium]|nr:UPF0149 family protein [Gammaproteobacteria bacterium]MDH5736066.1 UPF0149 family protein [Gammaproteobacteria bacterium]
MIDRPDYNRLQDALTKTDAEMSAPESHGALSGMFCAKGQVALADWLNQVFVELDLNNMLVQEASQLLVGLFKSTQEQLNDAGIDYQLLLPDDEQPLAERVDALAQWCQGFTYGLAAGGLKQDSDLPEDTAELIRDMVEIARAGHDDEMVDEADEDAYVQLYEYVRMAVLLINEELQPCLPVSDVKH